MTEFLKYNQTRPVYDEACRLWGKTPIDQEFVDEGWDELFSHFAAPTEVGTKAVQSLHRHGYPEMPSAYLAYQVGSLRSIAHLFVVEAAGDVFERLAVQARRQAEYDQRER